MNKAASVPCGCKGHVSAKGTGDGEASTRCWVVRTSCTPKNCSFWRFRRRFWSLRWRRLVGQCNSGDAHQSLHSYVLGSIELCAVAQSCLERSFLSFLRRVVAVKAVYSAQASSIQSVVSTSWLSWHLFKVGVAEAGTCAFLLRIGGALQCFVVFGEAHPTLCGDIHIRKRVNTRD